MKKQSIAEQALYVKKIFQVIQSRMHGRQKKISQVGRHSDAFVFIQSGACTYCTDGREMTANAGDVLYLAHNADYDMYVHDGIYRYIYCDFEFDSDAPHECACFTPEGASHTENLFHKLLHAYRSDSPAALAEMLSILYEIYASVIRSQSGAYIEKAQRNRIEEAKRYVDFHFTDPELCISQVARTAEMSEVYFRRLFKAKYGISPLRYIVSLRLGRARELMKYPFLSLDECAKQSGFSSQQYFCKVFREQIGVTPTDYRKAIIR
jgi:AraC-like DNA-binding protein